MLGLANYVLFAINRKKMEKAMYWNSHVSVYCLFQVNRAYIISLFKTLNIHVHECMLAENLALQWKILNVYLQIWMYKRMVADGMSLFSEEA